MHSGNFPKAKAKILFSFDFVFFALTLMTRHGNTLPLMGFARQESVSVFPED